MQVDERSCACATLSHGECSSALSQLVANECLCTLAQRADSASLLGGTMRMIAFIVLLLIVGAVFVSAQGGAADSGYVEPRFTLVEEEGNIQIRSYEEFVIAEVSVAGSWWNASSIGFRPLVSYITGENVASEKIPMTTPVSQQMGSNNQWKVAFYINKDYSNTPDPRNQSVSIQRVPERLTAAIRFPGARNNGNFERHEAELRSFLNSRNIAFEDNPIYAYYNDPFTPAFARRNEVMFVINQ